MSSSHHKILRLLKRIEQSLGMREIKQEVKVENNVNQVDSSPDLIKLNLKIGEIQKLLMDISKGVKQIEKELHIQGIKVATSQDNPQSNRPNSRIIRGTNMSNDRISRVKN